MEPRSRYDDRKPRCVTGALMDAYFDFDVAAANCIGAGDRADLVAFITGAYASRIKSKSAVVNDVVGVDDADREAG